MPAHTEIELKWELTAIDYQRLAVRLDESLGPPRMLVQDNRFFDTPSRVLRRLGMNVRVRRETAPAGAHLYVTCKRRLDVGAAGAHQHEEWEQDVDVALWSAVEAGDASHLPLSAAVTAALASERLGPLGGFSNKRREHRDGAELLCLDRTDLVKRVDYEARDRDVRPGERRRGLVAAAGVLGDPLVGAAPHQVRTLCRPRERLRRPRAAADEPATRNHGRAWRVRQAKRASDSSRAPGPAARPARRPSASSP